MSYDTLTNVRFYVNLEIDNSLIINNRVCRGIALTDSRKPMKPTKKLFVADPSWRGFLGAMIGARNLGVLSGGEAEVSFEFVRVEDIPAHKMQMYEFIYVIDGRKNGAAGLNIGESRFIRCSSVRKCAGFFIRSYVQANGGKPFSVAMMRADRKMLRRAGKLMRKVPELRTRIDSLVREEDRSEMMKAEAYRMIGMIESVGLIAAHA